MFQQNTRSNGLYSRRTEYRLRRMVYSVVDGFNNIYRNDYQISMHGRGHREEDLVGALNSGFSRQSLTNIAADAMSYRTAGQSLDIDNGWGSDRLVWTLELDVISELKTELMVVMGYSDRLDVYNGMIDPETKLYVTSSMKLHRPAGSSRIIIPSNNMLLPAENRILARPTDIFNTMSRKAEADSMSAFVRGEHSFSTTEYNTRSEFSKTENSSAASWLSRTLRSHTNTTRNANFEGIGRDEVRLNQQMAGECGEDSVRDDSLLGDCQIIREELIESNGSFRISTLDNVLQARGLLSSPRRAGEEVVLIELEQVSKFGLGTDSDNWNQASHDARVAVAARESMNSLMLRHLLTHINFRLDPTGPESPILGAFSESVQHMNPSLGAISGVSDSMTSEMKRSNAISLVELFIADLLPLMTPNGQPGWIMVDYDIRGHITIATEFSRGSHKFVAPAFSMGKTAPVTLKDEATLDELIDQFSDLTISLNPSENVERELASASVFNR